MWRSVAQRKGGFLKKKKCAGYATPLSKAAASHMGASGFSSQRS
jgi:hypothetical protein